MSTRKPRPLSPQLVRLAVTAIIALITSSVLSFVNLVVNYGFHPDFWLRWAKAWAIGYALLLPIMFFVVPVLQRVLVSAFVGSGNADRKSIAQ